MDTSHTPTHHSTTSAVIDALGGNRGMARVTGATAKAVSNWRVIGFPAWTYLVIHAALIEIGHSAPPNLWNMPVPEQSKQMPSRKRAA